MPRVSIYTGTTVQLASGTMNHRAFSIFKRPFDILHALNKTFICPPGTCGAYASPGYELLGLALCNSYGEESCSSWEDLDQKRVLDRAGLRSRLGYFRLLAPALALTFVCLLRKSVI